jgi:GNAT superfamily N-acetyltransferase
MRGDVSTRRLLPEDTAFLRSVFASTRSLEVEVLGSQGPGAEAFLRVQFDAQGRHYEACYPNAEHLVVLVRGEPAGRLIVDRSATEILIVDIALLPRSRRAGVGSALVEGLLDEADGGGLQVRCHVLLGNDGARRFWERHGLVARGVVGAHVAMVRVCEISRL